MSTLPNLKVPKELEPFVEDTGIKHRRDVAILARESFADHRLEEILDTEKAQIWLCGRPDGSSIYHFYVSIVPHAIAVYGDIGDMFIRPGWNRGLGWLRGAIHDGRTEHFDYLLGKVPNKQQHKVFLPGDVLADLDDHVAEEDEHYAKQAQHLADAWADEYGGYEDIEQSWYRACYDNGEEAEWYYNFSDYDVEMYWCAHALAWFVREWVKQHEETSDGNEHPRSGISAA